MALWRRWLALAVIGAVCVSGCAAPVMVRPVLVSRAHVEAPPEEDDGPAFLPWAATEPVVVIIDKDTRTLAVYESGRQTALFPAVFGRVEGRKLYEGDKRTPSGVYRITKKRPHWRFYRFFDLDYPNRDDVRNFQEARAAGIVPASLSNGKRPGTGGLIGIHGSDDEKLNRVDLDWTLGCVSLLNDHMDELDGLVDTGTPVLIRDSAPPAWFRPLLPEPEVPAAPTVIQALRDDPPPSGSRGPFSGDESSPDGELASVVEDDAAGSVQPSSGDEGPPDGELASSVDDRARTHRVEAPADDGTKVGKISSSDDSRTVHQAQREQSGLLGLLFAR